MLDYKMKNAREFKKFSYPTKNDIHTSNSYSCFLITNDNYVILAQRKHGFYLSYIINSGKKKLALTNKKKGMIIECIKHLEIQEIVTLLSVLHKNNLIDLSVCLSEEEFFDIIKNNDRNNVLKNIENIIDTKDSNFMYQLYNIIYDFRNYYFRGQNDKLISIHKNKTIMLPGGKKDLSDKTNLDIILREVCEELNLEINKNTSMVLTKNLEVVKLLSKDDIEPCMDCYTKDFVLNYYYYDKVFVILIDKTLDEIKKNFVSNTEVSDIVFYKIKINMRNNITSKTLKEFLNYFKNNCYI